MRKKNKTKTTKGACSSPISMTGLERLASDRHSGLFIRIIIDEDFVNPDTWRSLGGVGEGRGLRVRRSTSFQRCLYNKDLKKEIKKIQTFSTEARGQFVEQKLLLSCSFRFDQIYDNHCFVFSHTLLCYLSPT
jgi:hypothetical protein